MIPWFAAGGRLLAVAGLVIGLVVAPTDATQSDAYRIIFIHVPAAWMSMFLYVVMAGWSAAALGFNTRLSAMMAQAIAPTGALMTFHRVVDGSVLGAPDVGNVLGVGRADDVGADPALSLPRHHCVAQCDRRPEARRQSLCRAGVDGCRQRSDHLLLRLLVEHAAPGIVGQHHASALDGGDHARGMLVMALAAWFYAIAVILARVRTIIVERERGASWVASLREVRHA
jgi:heme exporter protein C